MTKLEPKVITLQIEFVNRKQVGPEDQIEVYLLLREFEQKVSVKPNGVNLMQ